MNRACQEVFEGIDRLPGDVAILPKKLVDFLVTVTTGASISSKIAASLSSQEMDSASEENVTSEAVTAAAT